MAEAALRDVYLQPGELQLVNEPAVIRTILGSCVGITFRHERLGLGGMCHPMLPHMATNRAASGTDPKTRFVDFAIEEMGRQLDSLGALRKEVEIKLFGGGDVLPVNHGTTRATVGRLNCESAIETLEAEGFAITTASLGGKCGVNIRFNTVTGEVLLRRLG
jgi:chemotaxis protein CheD